MVRSGALGEIRKVTVEYNQGWLAGSVEGHGNKQVDWRMDPARSGRVGAMGDIGSHAEHLAATVTGLELQSLCADLTGFGEGRQLDDDAQVLLRYTNGARGVIIASQVAAGLENDLRLQMSGSLGSVIWRQEEPNQLLHAPLDCPRRTLTRGSPWLCESARLASRLPAGHPEAFIEAFANIYLGLAADIRAHVEHQKAAALHANYPRVEDGARGVHFMEKVLASHESDLKWTAL